MVKVKILGLVFSPRHGNTEILVKEALKASEELPEVETQYYDMVGKEMNLCKADYRCFREQNPKKPCPMFTDAFDEIVPLVNDADGLIIGSPVYWHTVTAYLKAFMDRSMAVEVFGLPWRNKVVGCLTVAFDRQGGHESTIKTIQDFCLIHDMILVGVGPERPAKGIGGYLGACACCGWPYPVSGGMPRSNKAVNQDEVGLFAARCLGSRVAEITKVVKAGFAEVPRKELRWPFGAIDLEYASQYKKRK